MVLLNISGARRESGWVLGFCTFWFVLALKSKYSPNNVLGRESNIVWTEKLLFKIKIQGVASVNFQYFKKKKYYSVIAVWKVCRIGTFLASLFFVILQDEGMRATVNNTACHSVTGWLLFRKHFLTLHVVGRSMWHLKKDLENGKVTFWL